MNELERAKAIVLQVQPTTNPEFACMLVAAAVAGLRGLSMKHIRLGALFWPDKFEGGRTRPCAAAGVLKCRPQ